MATLDADPRVETIHCVVVRNASNRHEISVLVKAVLHECNLNLPRLGLSEHDAQTIFSKAELIIHNGADISYLKGYSSLCIANLQSTKKLAALSFPRLIPFSYISAPPCLQPLRSGLTTNSLLRELRLIRRLSTSYFPPLATTTRCKVVEC